MEGGVVAPSWVLYVAECCQVSQPLNFLLVHIIMCSLEPVNQHSSAGYMYIVTNRFYWGKVRCNYQKKGRKCSNITDRKTTRFPSSPTATQNTKHNSWPRALLIANMAAIFEQPRNGTLFLGGQKISGSDIRDQNG